jgi:hypothetical protein
MLSSIKTRTYFLRLASLLILSVSSTGFAAGFGNSNVSKEGFVANYEALKAKLNSSAPLAEKMNFIKTQDQAYIQMFREMKAEVVKNLKLADHPDYLYVLELYDQYIPLLSLKLEANGKLSEVSCLESQGLVFTKDREIPVEDGEDVRLSPESLTTAELLKKLCN